MDRESRSLLINSDRFLLLSGQRSYFYEQKEFYTAEIERLNNLYQKAYFKKTGYKKKWRATVDQMDDLRLRMEQELAILREKVWVY
jgi:hypothetical protein